MFCFLFLRKGAAGNYYKYHRSRFNLHFSSSIHPDFDQGPEQQNILLDNSFYMRLNFDLNPIVPYIITIIKEYVLVYYVKTTSHDNYRA